MDQAMRMPGQPDRLSRSNPAEDFRGVSRLPWREQACTGIRSNPDHIYDLRLRAGNSDRFYADVARFSLRVLMEVESRAGAVLDDYIQHVDTLLRETPRSRGDYGIEFLTLGMALELYAGAAAHTPSWVTALAHSLLLMRRRFQRAKPAADLLRAALFRVFALGNLDSVPAEPPGLSSLPRLIKWLQASGEFEQEARRLENWRSYLASLPECDADTHMQTAVDLFDWFTHEAGGALGVYTRGVSRFLTTAYASRGLREDQLFCGKQPVEYHLGMVAAEVMNRGLLPDFDRTSRKIVLLPTCMRGAHAADCRARVRGVDITCTGCDPDCAVNRITRRMRPYGVPVYLVPHSTGFSRWLERWQSQREVGVIAVACMLNILPGGYEMRDRAIAAQCVPLDFPGCRKHWSRNGIPTGTNEDRLVQIATGHDH